MAKSGFDSEVDSEIYICHGIGKQIAFRKSARTTQSSIATQTISSGEENACFGQILNKLNEIQRKQLVTNKKLLEMDRQMKLVRAELDLLADRIAPRVGVVRANSFEFEPIGCKEELDDFEQNLRGQEFKIKMRQFVDARLPTESIEARLHASVDVLFKRDFVVKLSWTGMGHPNPKIAFKDYNNVLNFYIYIGTCHGFNATDIKIKSFLQNKFRHSIQRLNLVGVVKTSYHRHSK
ncbi:uncharacterized protein LOC128297707 [Anopheles moucheti]|uniref:uncharacterized protein LOC128297707 n=1 Tax=Anopheles moucheti TaxID=186751 RepID=UPI0022F0BA22|nr:uncharacterized protein LOC128297707 [Anopheles moucheti]